jgi:hypothetical protein
MLKEVTKNFIVNFLEIGKIKLITINHLIRGFPNLLIQSAIPHMNNNISSFSPKHKWKFLGMENTSYCFNNSFVTMFNIDILF